MSLESCLVFFKIICHVTWKFSRKTTFIYTLLSVGGSMTDSMMWNAMTTSMQLAQECLKEDPSTGEEQAEASPPFEGLESFAQTIESGM